MVVFLIYSLQTFFYKSINILLPRTADAQALQGEKIKKMEDLEPGDLVFFATGKKKRQITHVGIVTEVKAKDNNLQCWMILRKYNLG